MHGTLETLRGTQSDAEKRPSRGEAEQAVRTLIRWAGEHPQREGLLDTPRRVVRAYEEWFEGYDQDPVEILQRTFEDVGGYDEIVALRDIPFQSCCEHHMAANKRSPPQAAGYFRTEPVGGSRIASGTPGLPLGVV